MFFFMFFHVHVVTRNRNEIVHTNIQHTTEYPTVETHHLYTQHTIRPESGGARTRAKLELGLGLGLVLVLGPGPRLELEFEVEGELKLELE